MLFSNVAYALGAAPQQGADAGLAGMFAQFLPIILIGVVFYFFLIRPQQKKAKAQREMIMSLKKGDAVITNGGFFGRIVDFQDEHVVLDLGETKVISLRNSLNLLPASQRSPIAPVKKSRKKEEKASEAEE